MQLHLSAIARQTGVQLEQVMRAVREQQRPLQSVPHMPRISAPPPLVPHSPQLQRPRQPQQDVAMDVDDQVFPSESAGLHMAASAAQSSNAQSSGSAGLNMAASATSQLTADLQSTGLPNSANGGSTSATSSIPETAESQMGSIGMSGLNLMSASASLPGSVHLSEAASVEADISRMVDQVLSARLAQFQSLNGSALRHAVHFPDWRSSELSIGASCDLDRAPNFSVANNERAYRLRSQVMHAFFSRADASNWHNANRSAAFEWDSPDPQIRHIVMQLESLSAWRVERGVSKWRMHCEPELFDCSSLCNDSMQSILKADSLQCAVSRGMPGPRTTCPPMRRFYVLCDDAGFRLVDNIRDIRNNRMTTQIFARFMLISHRVRGFCGHGHAPSSGN